MSQSGILSSSSGGGGGSKDSFSAYLSSPTGNVTGDGTLYGPVVFDGILSNAGGNYSAVTGLYTCPTTGVYCFTHTITFLGGDATTTSYLTIWNGSAYGSRAFQLMPQPQAGANTTILSATIVIPMTAADTLGIQVLVAGVSPNIVIYGAVPTGVASTSLFSGFQL